jgi:hypothetical protein
MKIEIIGIMVNIPRPVFGIAWKNFSGCAAVMAAGTGCGNPTVLVGFVHWLVVPHDTDTPTILEAEALRTCTGVPDVLNCVDVIVRLQPPPNPVASVTEIGSV